MKLSKAIKKIAAISSGAVMLGATVMGAMAATLSDYPAPFLTDGELDTILVVGAAAASSDVIGVTDIAASLQAKMITPVEGAAEVVQVTGESALLETKGDTLTLTEDIDSSVSRLDDSDLPTLLASGTVEDEDDKEYDYDLNIEISNGTIEYDTTRDTDIEDPLVNIHTGTAAVYSTVIDIDAVNVTLLANADITLFGDEYTFTSKEADLDNESITLYKTATTTTIESGETKTISGIEVSIENVNEAGDEAMITLDDKAYTVDEGDIKGVGDIDVYIKDIFAGAYPAKGLVEVSVGSQEVVLEDGQAVEIGGEDVDGTEVTIESIGGKVTKIQIDVIPNDMDSEVEYIETGEEGLTDPVFGTFKLVLAGMTPAIDDTTNRNEINFEVSGEDVEIEFTNKDGVEYELAIIEVNDTDASLKSANKDFVTTNTSDIDQKKQRFLVNAGSNPTYTHILELIEVDISDEELSIRDLADGSEVGKWVSSISGYLKLEEDVYFTINNDTDNNITLVEDPAGLIYTENDIEIDLSAAAGNLIAGNKTYITLTEDAEELDYTTDISFNVTIDVNSDEDAEVEVASALVVSTDDKPDTGLTNLGTFIKVDDEDGDNTFVRLTVPNEEVFYTVFFGAIESTTVTTAAAGAGVITPMSVGVSKLDTEVADVTAQNAIIVGGPCVNRAAAEALGLTYPACGAASTIPENQAIIKLVSTNGKVALVVAGWTADDTRRASRVIARPENYALTGTEVTVSGTTLTDISVTSIA